MQNPWWVKRKNDSLKSINLFQSSVGLPAEGLPVDTFVEIPEREEFQEAVDRRRLPFFLRGIIILTFLMLGVVLLAAAAYYTLIRPVDFSGKPQSIAPSERAVMAPVVKVPEPARKPVVRPSESMPRETTSPIFTERPDPSPPSGSLSLSARQPVGEPPPVKKPSMSAISMSEKKKGEEKAESKPEEKAAEEKAELKKSPPAEAKPPTKPTKVAKALPAEAPPRKKAPAPRPEKTATVTKGRYSIQVGACRTSKCVSNLTARLKKAEFEPITEKSRSGKWTLIMTGEYQTLRVTRPVVEKLKERGFKGSYAIKR